VYGEEHPATLVFIMYLARSYNRQKKYAESEALFLQHLEVMRRKYGEDHDETLRTKHELATLYMDAGPLDKAVQLFEECLSVYRRDAKNADRESTITTLYNLGGVYLKQKNFAKAEAAFSEVLASYRRTVGDDHADTVDAMRVLGRIYDELGERGKAEQMLRAYLAADAGNPSRGLNFLAAQSRLGGILFAQGKLSEAEPLLLASFEGLYSLSAKIPRDSQDLPIEFLERLVKFHQTKPDPAKAAAWQKTLDALRAALPKPAPDAAATSEP
jgi:tetratricopeptide (TPR) repeat protein